MKIAINMQVQSGPFGGGNQFLKQLIQYFQDKKIEVIHKLDADDIDIILMMDPRPYLSMTSFGPKEILNYKFKNPHVCVVHRINECDERKGTHFMNSQIVLGNLVADASIFVSKWLMDLYVNQAMSASYSCVIHNGSNKKVFKWEKKELPVESKIRIVTHHFSANFMKGWDAYLEIDRLMSTEKWKNKLEFHFIGNAPKNLMTKNINFHPPMSGDQLAAEISKNHIYITGSLNEPGSNHQIEGALCGLPLIYINSGGIPETCHGYGAMFSNVSEIESALDNVINNYSNYQAKLEFFPFDGLHCVEQYHSFFKNYKAMVKLKKFSFFSYLVANFRLTFGFTFYRVMSLMKIY